MPLRLVASAGRPDILVDRVLVVVGRDPHCDSRLVSPRVSRWHCCLTAVDGNVWVRDLGSTNGIWINGLRVMSGRVRPGDVLAIAHIRYRLEEAQGDRESGTDSPGQLDQGSASVADPRGTSLFDECDDG
jgi:pSer/pThr/pTyr-binding forkhead associated (FHA) protein